MRKNLIDDIRKSYAVSSDPSDFMLAVSRSRSTSCILVSIDFGVRFCPFIFRGSDDECLEVARSMAASDGFCFIVPNRFLQKELDGPVINDRASRRSGVNC